MTKKSILFLLVVSCGFLYYLNSTHSSRESIQDKLVNLDKFSKTSKKDAKQLNQELFNGIEKVYAHSHKKKGATIKVDSALRLISEARASSTYQLVRSDYGPGHVAMVYDLATLVRDHKFNKTSLNELRSLFKEQIKKDKYSLYESLSGAILEAPADSIEQVELFKFLTDIPEASEAAVELLYDNLKTSIPNARQSENLREVANEKIKIDFYNQKIKTLLDNASSNQNKADYAARIFSKQNNRDVQKEIVSLILTSDQDTFMRFLNGVGGPNKLLDLNLDASMFDKHPYLKENFVNYKKNRSQH